MKEIIEFAAARGYTGHRKFMPLILPRTRLDPYMLLEHHESDIFFDHEFLRSVFGNEAHEEMCLICNVRLNVFSNWQRHAQELALIFPDKRKEYIHYYIKEQTHDGVDETRKDS